jgi:hypothetical protein
MEHRFLRAINLGREYVLREQTRSLELSIAKLESTVARLELALVAKRNGKPLDIRVN